MFNGFIDSPEYINKRLEQLKQWQIDQQKILIEKKSAQRLLLNKEQQDVYNFYGFSHKSMEFSNSNSTPKENEIANDKSGNKYTNSNATDDLSSAGMMNLGQDNKQQDESLINNIPKRPFLKRGQGLTARFKIDPDSLKLNNLPKYKYSNSHKKYNALLKGNKRNRKGKNDQVIIKSNNVNNIEISKENPNRNDKLILIRDKLKLRNPTSGECERKTDVKLPESSSLPQTVEEKKSPHRQVKNNNSNNGGILSSLDQSKDSSSTSKPMSWAKILDPTNIEPVIVSKLRNLNSSSSDINNAINYHDDTEDSSIFELLEKKAEEGSICFDSSTIKRWLQNRLKLLSIESSKDSDEILISNIPKELKNARIHPLPCDINEKDLLRSSDDDDDDDNNDDDDYYNKNGDKDNNDDDKLSQSSETENKCDNRSGHIVRFSDDVQVNEVVESDTDTIKSNDVMNDNEINSTMTSTPIDKEEFEKFKKNLFKNSIQSLEDLTLIAAATDEQNKIQIDDLKKDIVEKSEILKFKLNELQQEIEVFQKHNNELIKMKQEHELEKIKLQQERNELEEKLNDERIKLEIYLHDERLKIEDEKKKLEKQLKLNRAPNRKEREETIKLKEEIENLQKELKSKESKHVSAQARLRAQIRNLEKDLKDLSFELDHLKKENKKLENENIRLNRQQSNKMLQEINKSIAKLAVPQKKEIPVTQVSNKNHKSVVAKVISHQKNSNSNQRSKSKRIPNLCHDDDDSDKSSSSSSSDTTSDSEFDDFENYNSKACNSNIGNSRTISKLSSVTNIDKNESQNSHELQKSTTVPSTSTLSSSSLNQETITTENFKREIMNSDGSKDIWYPNGNLKKISPDGMIVRMLYFNKDIKETNIHEGTVKYYYAETNTWHTTYLDGLEILEFPNGQTEHRYKDGKIEIHFPNGSIRITNPNDDVKLEEWRYSDGTSLVKMKNGDKILLLPNGQKEIHTRAHKRREYPDGTVKLVYPDGSQETRYSNGRVRLKDKDGNLIMDSENIK